MTIADKNRTIRAAIVGALQSGPKTTHELVSATRIEGTDLSSRIKMLLKDGEISRVETTKGRYRYYIGDTAPGWTGYVPAVRNPDVPRLTGATKHAVAVSRVTYPLEGGRVNRVTLPAAPWEAAA